MADTQVVEWIHAKYRAIVADLDERARRRWAAAEARSLGWGGVAAVAMATGISDRTIRNGIRELDDPDALPPDRQRTSGAGRRSGEQEDPGLIEALEALMEPISRGDPMSPLRWTCKSTYVLADELTSQGFVVSSTKVGALLKSQGYSPRLGTSRIGDSQNLQAHSTLKIGSPGGRGRSATTVDGDRDPIGAIENTQPHVSLQRLEGPT